MVEKVGIDILKDKIVKVILDKDGKVKNVYFIFVSEKYMLLIIVIFGEKILKNFFIIVL